VKRLVVRFLLGWSAYPLKGAAGVEALEAEGSGSEAGRLRGLRPSGKGFTSFNILSCVQGALAFADKMATVDADGECVRAAAVWLDRLGPQLLGGLGLQEKDKEPPPPVRRVEWTAAIERIAEVARGCDRIYLISDRTPGVSVERITDEVQQLNSEMGHGWRARIDTVALDAPAVAVRMLRRIAAETASKFSKLSAHTLRQQLLWDCDVDAESGLVRAERSSGCLPAPGPAYVPLLAARERERERTGSVGHELLLEGGRSVILVLNGEGESHVDVFGARTERGLRLTVFNKDWTEKMSRTYDTWASLAEANALANELSRCTSNETLVITSFDAWERCFHHQLAQSLTECGIDGRQMLKHCEQAKASWEKLHKDLGCDPGDDARPAGHGHPVAAIGIPGKKPWGRTLVIEDVTANGEPATLAVSLNEIAAARGRVLALESGVDRSRVSGVCKILTPQRYTDDGMNTLPGHAFSSPSKKNAQGQLERPEIRSLNSLI
jgi:hypothetical protein